MNPDLLGSILLLLLSAVLVLMEILTPSMGVLSIFAAILAAIGVYFGFEVSNTVGYAMLLVCIFGTPVLVILGIKYLPDSYIGRKIFLRRADDATADACPIADELAALVGQSGVAESELRPAGIVRVGDKRYDARSEYGLIEQGTKIEILRAGGTDVVVRPANQTSEQ